MKQPATPPIVTTSMESPIGVLTLTAADGVVTGLFMPEQRHAPVPCDAWEHDGVVFKEAVAQLRAYFVGTRLNFDLPLALEGTDFQRRVWAQLREIPYGETISYGEMARRIGNPNASRAVGLANGRNPVAIIVPCHRVIGANGSLTGYAGGIDRKIWLLEHEGAALRNR